MYRFSVTTILSVSTKFTNVKQSKTVEP